VKLPSVLKNSLGQKVDMSHNKAMVSLLKKHIQTLQLQQGNQGLGDWQEIVTPQDGAAKEIVITPEQPQQEAAAGTSGGGQQQQQGTRRQQRASVPGLQPKPNMPGGPPYQWPKLIHQTVARREKLSCQEMTLMESWVKLNPGYR
jgi:hypothetical protein